MKELFFPPSPLFLKADERRSVVLEALARVFSDKVTSELVHYKEQDWSSVPYNNGGPVSIMTPGCLMYFHPSLRKPHIRSVEEKYQV